MSLMWILTMACIVVVLLGALLGFAIRRADGRNDYLTRYRRDNRAAGPLRDKTCPPW